MRASRTNFCCLPVVTYKRENGWDQNPNVGYRERSTTNDPRLDDSYVLGKTPRRTIVTTTTEDMAVVIAKADHDDNFIACCNKRNLFDE